MKKYIIIVTLLLLPLVASGQSRSFRALSDKYSGRQGYTVVEMSGDMLKAISSSGKKSVMDNIPLNNIDNMVIIVSEKESSDFRNDVKTMISEGLYLPLSKVNSSGSKVSFYVSKSHGIIKEIVMTVYDGSDNVVVSITGTNLSVDQIVGKFEKGL